MCIKGFLLERAAERENMLSSDSLLLGGGVQGGQLPASAALPTTKAWTSAQNPVRLWTAPEIRPDREHQRSQAITLCPLPLLPNAVKEEAGWCGPPGDSPARKPSFPNSNKQKSITEHRPETPARLVPARHASGWPRGSSGRPWEDRPRTTQAPARHRPSSEAGMRHGAPRL